MVKRHGLDVEAKDGKIETVADIAYSICIDRYETGVSLNLKIFRKTSTYIVYVLI